MLSLKVKYFTEACLYNIEIIFKFVSKGKGIYKKDLRTAYNWPDNVPYCSLNNTKQDIDEGTNTSLLLKWYTIFVCRIRQTLVMEGVKDMANVLRMHLKARVDFTSCHNVPNSADLATVSKRCFII